MSAMIEFLRERGVQCGWRAGWQSVKCPFHGDSNASASVHVDRGKFHCFACGIFEDVIGLMRLEGATYAEAKREAKERFGQGEPQVRGESESGSRLPFRSRGMGGNSSAASARRRLI